MFDISKIKERISCVDVAQRCGLPIQREGDRCISPLRKEAHNPSSFAVDRDFWYDFGDGHGGDAIDLMAAIKYDGDKGKAIRELARLTGVVDDNPRPDGWMQYTQNLCNQIAYWQSQLTEADRDYLHSRGLTDETIEALKFGRTEDGRLSIPYLKNGYVAYYCTRALPGGAYPESKYRKQRKDDYCEHIVWGLDSLNRSTDTLIIAEGAFDAISFWQEGYPVISAITGLFSKAQIPTVISAARKFNRVLIVYDNDLQTHAGDRFTLRTADLLTRHRIPFVVGTVPQPWHDISEYYAAGLDLKLIVDTARPGVAYLASQIHDFSELESYIFRVARHTKKSELESIISQLKKTTEFDSRRLDALLKAATTAPPETIIADEILREHQLVYLPSIGFYEYTNGVWHRQPDDQIQRYADHAYGEFSTAQRVRAIPTLLRTRALRTDIVFDAKPLWNFVNGTLELDTGNFREANPADFCSLQADYPYNPSATFEHWSKFIDDITAGDPRSAELLQLIPGYVFEPDSKYEKVFVLSGSGGNGKSKYLEILRQLFGESCVSHLSPRALLDKFQLIAFRESIVNIAGEIRSDLRDVEEKIKSVASGEPQTACYKSKDFVNFIPRTKLIYATNSQLTSGDTSEGLARRLIIVDFKVSFVDNPTPGDPYQRKKDVDILDQLEIELQSGGIFNWAYEGYKTLKAVGYFTATQDQDELLTEFKRSSNPVLVYYEDRASELPQTVSNRTLYQDYAQWCSDNGEHTMPSRAFCREFKRVSAGEFEQYRTANERGYRRMTE